MAISRRSTRARPRASALRPELSHNVYADDAAYLGGKIDMTRLVGEPRTMTRYNKFLVVAAKQKDGMWNITHDASGPATKEAWEGQPQSYSRTPATDID